MTDTNVTAKELELFVDWCKENWRSDAVDPNLDDEEKIGWNACLIALDTAMRHYLGSMDREKPQ